MLTAMAGASDWAPATGVRTPRNRFQSNPPRPSPSAHDPRRDVEGGALEYLLWRGDLFRLPPRCDILFMLTRWRADAEIEEVEVVRVGGGAHRHNHRRQRRRQCTAVRMEA
ncbi:unnamed protein product [Urochloa humidicola]